MGEAAPEWILQTQSTLGSVVKKPKLTDNLLKKPPFRFCTMSSPRYSTVKEQVANYTGDRASPATSSAPAGQ